MDKSKPFFMSWFQKLFLTLVLVLLVILTPSCSTQQYALPDEYLPTIQILEILSSHLNRNNTINLMKPKNTDVIIGEDTSATSRILIKCNATYPVQIMYLGDGSPEFSTITNVKWHDDPTLPMSFEAEASLGLLGFQGVLREQDSGNYTCRSIQEPSIHSYYYIYVPGDNLFASPNGSNITYTPSDQYVRIPCGVSHPKASVSLCKRDKDGNLTCPISGASGFNSKGGFLLNLKKQRDPSGTYVCTANFKGTFRVVEHVLMKEGDKPKPKPPLPLESPLKFKPGKNLCDPSPCGKQAECNVVDGRAVCYCFRGLSGNPYDECVHGKCRTSKDCPRGKFCRQGECTSDPCNPSPCGKGSECTNIRGHSKCSCQFGYAGLPPNCVKSCSQNYDCTDEEACIKNICQSPCPGPCGQHAECRVLANGPKRTAQCSCPNGYLGDPLKSCYEFGANLTTPGPWNRCPPGYVGQPPACSRKECELDQDCPFGRKCVENICDKGNVSPCPDKCGINAECHLSATTPDPICTCPSGTTGNPTVECFIQSTSSSPSWGNSCTPNPCQNPAQCHVVQGQRTCVCPQGYVGDPNNCIPSTVSYPSPSTGFSGGDNTQCRFDAECRPGHNCIAGQCQEGCNGLCGYNAICEHTYQRKYRSIYSSKLLRSQGTVCTCPAGHEGNPYVSCIPIRNVPPASSSMPSSTSSMSPPPNCFPSPCGKFAECSMVNNSPICRCYAGFEGNPYQDCRMHINHPSPTFPSDDVPMPMSPQPTGRINPVSPSDLDFQGHSWGHHNIGDTAASRPNINQNDYKPQHNPPSPSSYRSDRPYHKDNVPYHHSPPPNYFDRDDRDFHVGKSDNIRPTAVHHIPHLYSPQPHLDTPTPKTLGRPMSPLAPMLPTEDDRDECTFKNPYADYDMDSCGVGRRCERDFRGIKRCVCISPFDCTGPTSIYGHGNCKTSRDCLLSDHICINGSCRNPCSPEFSPCAGIAYSECRVIEGNVLCTCRRGYVGNPSNGLDCRPKRSAFVHSPGVTLISNIGNNQVISTNSSEHESDVIISAGDSSDVAHRHQQRHNHEISLKEIGGCGFGSGSFCDEKSHCRIFDGRPMCVCKTGYKGKYPNCKPECEKHDDCSETMACQYHQCMDPCIEEQSYCATNAICSVANHTASCECEPGYTGIPWIQCSKIGEQNDCMGFNCKNRKSS